MSISETSELNGIYFKPLRSKPINWQGPSIDVVSLGCGDNATLRDNAIMAISQADFVFGSEHHFSEISRITLQGETIVFPSPFSKLRNFLDQYQSKKLVVLASGDALFYGVGSWLNKLVGNQNLNFHPNISSIQHCFHAIGQPWQHAEIVSLHGRPLHTLRRHIRHNHLLAIFTDNRSNPHAIARELDEQGFGNSDIWVCQDMASKKQSIDKFTASELSNTNNKEPTFNPLNVCIVHQKRDDPAALLTLPTFPGIPDHLFVTGSKPGFGMISKREVRLSILSLMSPQSGEVAWDIGAGCGSVSVEWARWNNLGQIYAIEKSNERIERIIENNERFGTSLNLIPIQGTAPQCCDSLPSPDCIFIGGSGGLSEQLRLAWKRLKPGGKIVASAVTEQSKEILQQFFEGKYSREWISIEIEKNLPHSSESRKLKTVIIGKCVKNNNPAVNEQ